MLRNVRISQDQAKDENALEGRHDGHGSDDVGRHKELEAEQDSPAEVLTEPAIPVGLPEANYGKPARGAEQPEDDREDTDPVDHQPDAGSRVGDWSIFRLKNIAMQTRVPRKHGPVPMKSVDAVDGLFECGHGASKPT